jgi:hypothetical protein
LAARTSPKIQKNWNTKTMAQIAARGHCFSKYAMISSVVKSSFSFKNFFASSICDVFLWLLFVSHSMGFLTSENICRSVKLWPKSGWIWKFSIVLLSYSTIDLFISLFGSYFKLTIFLKNEKNLKFIEIRKKFHNVFHNNIKDKIQRKTDFSSKIKLFFENIIRENQI